MGPFTSMPSPWPSTVMVPPFTCRNMSPVAVKVFCPSRPPRAEPSAPPATLMPSSEAVTSSVPPSMVIWALSSPS